MSKQISYDDYLKALGLFTIAKHHADKATEFEQALSAHLGVESGGHVMDALYTPGKTFDEALKYEGIEVAERATPRKD